MKWAYEVPGMNGAPRAPGDARKYMYATSRSNLQLNFLQVHLDRTHLLFKQISALYVLLHRTAPHV